MHYDIAEQTEAEIDEINEQHAAWDDAAERAEEEYQAHLAAKAARIKQEAADVAAGKYHFELLLTGSGWLRVKMHGPALAAA